LHPWTPTCCVVKLLERGGIQPCSVVAMGCMHVTGMLLVGFGVIVMHLVSYVHPGVVVQQLVMGPSVVRDGRALCLVYGRKLSAPSMCSTWGVSGQVKGTPKHQICIFIAMVCSFAESEWPQSLLS
jgi:hypothetical protein